MKSLPIVEELLHPTKGLLRGIFGDEMPAGKGGPDKDAKLVKITVGELRRADRAIRQPDAECDRAWRAYQAAHDQATANGGALALLSEELAALKRRAA